MGGRLGRVGPYALLEQLGRGGMGEVYLAATRRGEQVALKLLRDTVADDAEARLRLDREIRALRRVESPYVAQVLDADLSGDRPYLVMEHIKGENLLDAVRRGGPLPESRLIALAEGLATALAIIHAAGVVHRDIKPANVLMGEDGPVLIDFGIAQVMDATRLTRTGTFLGTPGYAAPELFADGEVSEPADVHAWAATVAFAATGRPTFGRGTAESQMYAILHGQADLKGVPVALLPLIRAAMHREPAKRPTAAMLADRLHRLARAINPAEPGESAREERALAAEAPARIPAGNAALLVLATLAVPCVAISVVYPVATFAITGGFVVLARALWSGHWLVRKRRSPKVRSVLRVATFPLTLIGSLIAALAWPGIPAAGATIATLWIAQGGQWAPDWWNQPVPVTVAGVVFGVVCGGIIGREVERIGAELPELRREGLRALAVLGGFVALCAAAVRVVALVF